MISPLAPNDFYTDCRQYKNPPVSMTVVIKSEMPDHTGSRLDQALLSPSHPLTLSPSHPLTP
jgi:hypothetical protein